MDFQSPPHCGFDLGQTAAAQHGTVSYTGQRLSETLNPFMGEDPRDSRPRGNPLGELGPGWVERRHVEAEASTPVIKYEQISVNNRVPAGHSPAPPVCAQR